MHCLLALGSNLGDRRTILEQACAEVAKLPDCELLARSRWHATLPIGGADGQGEFLNGAILLETTMRPQALAICLQQVETTLGRKRTQRWDARTIDIDMLLYGQQVIDTVELTVPHPRMSFRTFVLEPAAEIAGPMLHPTSGWTLARLLDHLQSSPRYVVVTATEKPIANWLASQISQEYPQQVSQKGNCLTLPDEEKSTTKVGLLHPDRGIEFPKSDSGLPPILVVKSPQDLSQESQKSSDNPVPAPALVIAVDVAEPKNLRAEAAAAGFDAEQRVSLTGPDPWFDLPARDFPGVGPLARIPVDDPATVLQEAQAAIRCIWPDIE